MQQADGEPHKDVKKPVSTDQLKRLLALIENNAQANALQRETTMNVLLRLELLEKNTTSKGSMPELPVVFKRQQTEASSPYQVGNARRIGNFMTSESSSANNTYHELLDRRNKDAMITPEQKVRGVILNPAASMDSTGPPPPKLGMYDSTTNKRKVGGLYRGR